MKTMVFEFSNPGPGDLVIINAEAPGGGKNSVKYKVLGARVRPQMDEDGFIVSTEQLPQDDPKAIAHILCGQISKEWMADCVRAKVKPDSGVLVVNCTDLFSNVKFSTEVHGEGGTTVTMSEF